MNIAKTTLAFTLAACLAASAVASEYFEYVKSVGITKVTVTDSKARVKLGKGSTLTKVPKGTYDIVDIVDGKVMIKVQGKPVEIHNTYIDFAKQIQDKGAKTYMEFFRDKAKNEHVNGGGKAGF